LPRSAILESDIVKARTFRRYWPWWIVIGWLLGYEAVAIATGRPTLSQMYWRAQDAWPGLPYIVIPTVVILILHFVWKKWR
jgi:hypothetical protein